ncbi:AEC family transporter [Ramlibacter sp. MAHUQ-53]|uniref:AEC family transporter n=1 Tax=unclassified Ramlibacter TaxID=2617605 RepID=UPI0036279900
MDHPVIAALLPVLGVIAVGLLAGRRRWVGQAGVRDLSNLVFLVLTPCLLFRTMSRVQAQALDFTPVAAYFAGVGVVFAATLAARGINRRATVLALAATFSNTVMIGIPLVGLAFGEQGLVTLFTLYTLHTVVLLTLATLLMELAAQREARAAEGGPPLRAALATAVRKSLLHPVPLPILAGLAFAQTGLALPAVVDKPLQMLGSALGPMALLLVGLSLAHLKLARELRGALGLVLAKNLVMPALVAAAGVMLGVTGLPLVVVVVVAGLPAGANSLLFSQRYQVAEDQVTATVGLSTLCSLATVPLVMAAATYLAGR